jgi:hypothetical protein
VEVAQFQVFLFVVEKDELSQGEVDVGEAELPDGVDEFGHAGWFEGPTADGEVMLLDLHGKMVAEKPEIRNLNTESNPKPE